MEDVTVNDVECAECGNLFEMLAEDFEEAEERFIRCPDCQAKALNEQIESEKPPKRCWKYMVAPMAPCEAEIETVALNIYGQSQWELIFINDNKAYFKREYYVKEI